MHAQDIDFEGEKKKLWKSHIKNLNEKAISDKDRDNSLA